MIRIALLAASAAHAGAVAGPAPAPVVFVDLCAPGRACRIRIGR